MTITEMREYMHQMEDTGQYRFYNTDIDKIPDEEVEDRYMTMRNYISDARTHDF